MPVFVEILIIMVLLLLNAALAMSEMAIISSRKTRLQQLATAGKRGARTALRLAEDPSPLLSTVQIGITLVSILLGIFSGATIADRLAAHLVTVPLIGPYSDRLSVVLVVIVVTYFSLVFGELVPKRLALVNAEGIAMAVGRPLLLLSKIAHPAVRVLSASTHVILRVLGSDARKDETLDQEEIKIVISQATEAGVVQETEQDMIEAVLSLGNLQADELMTPRHEFVVLDVSDTPEETWRKIFESGHSFFPVADGDLTKVLGFTSIKTLAEDAVMGRPLDLRKNLTPALYVPETAPALKILEKFKAQKAHLAFVVDEYGGIEGLISVTDIAEAVVGEMPSTEDDTDPEMVKREDGSWLIDGAMSIELFKEHFKIKRMPKRHAGDYNTLGGFVMAHLSRIPKAADHFTWRGLRIEVMDMDRHRVDKILVSRLPAEGRKKKKKTTTVRDSKSTD